MDRVILHEFRFAARPQILVMWGIVAWRIAMDSIC